MVLTFQSARTLRINGWQCQGTPQTASLCKCFICWHCKYNTGEVSSRAEFDVPATVQNEHSDSPPPKAQITTRIAIVLCCPVSKFWLSLEWWTGRKETVKGSKSSDGWQQSSVDSRAAFPRGRDEQRLCLQPLRAPLGQSTLKCISIPPHPSWSKGLQQRMSEILVYKNQTSSEGSTFISLCLASSFIHGEYFGIYSHSRLTAPAVWVDVAQNNTEKKNPNPIK